MLVKKQVGYVVGTYIYPAELEKMKQEIQEGYKHGFEVDTFQIVGNDVQEGRHTGHLRAVVTSAKYEYVDDATLVTKPAKAKAKK